SPACFHACVIAEWPLLVVHLAAPCILTLACAPWQRVDTRTRMFKGLPTGASCVEGGSRHMESIRILIIDEHPLFIQGCRWALEGAGDCVVIAEASDSRSGLELAKQHSPDVVLIDALLSTNDALELA